MTFQEEPIDKKAIATIRTLSADVVGKANSGHPGAPMGLAPAAHILWSRFLIANPKNSRWINRDRFVLSNGHACALQYIMLHFLGYKVTMDDLQKFRQLDSVTPGHPEAGVTDGIEVTTGPLGQGFGNAVGLAIAQTHLAAKYNREGHELFNNYTYVFTGDGCLQEGVASEAASLAGHLKLGNLIAIYDDNEISIDGDTAVSFTENVEQRFLGYGWNVLRVEDGNSDLPKIYEAIAEAKKVKDKPTIIHVRTTIGYGSQVAGTGGVHGSPLKPDDVKHVKKQFGFDPEKTFEVPKEVYDAYQQYAARGAGAEEAWNQLFAGYKEKYPTEGAELSRRIEGKFPDGWEKKLPVYTPQDPAIASRKLSENVLNAIADVLPELIGGSADLTGSNLTRWKTAVDFQPDGSKFGKYDGRYIRYGVREHGMGAIMNGLAAYGGIIPFAGTFLNFVSYAAGAVRLSALSHFRTIWVATHDSIGLGEDGPTHQPVETATHFRALPNCQVWRPADGNETSAAYLVALHAKNTPSILCLSRQNLPQLEGSTIENAAKGGYVIHEAPNADITLVSTGSEVAIALEAAKLLKDQHGHTARVVSLPCWEAFDAQEQEYRLKVIPDGSPVLSIEAYVTLGWNKYAHECQGVDTFGASGPYKDVYAKFNLTPQGIAASAKKVIGHELYQDKGKIRSPLRRAL